MSILPCCIDPWSEQQGQSGFTWELKFSQDSRLVLASFIDGTFSIYEAQTGEDQGQESVVPCGHLLTGSITK